MLKTLGNFAEESGITLARVSKILADVEPEQVIGRTKGYHPDALKSALINKFSDELKYLGVQDYAANIMTGFAGDEN